MTHSPFLIGVEVFTALPKETVFEARAKAQRDTVLLVFLLLAIYIACFNLLALAAVIALGTPMAWWGSALPKVWFFGTLIGVLFGFAHYWSASHRSLDDLLATLGAQPADPQDERHARLIQLVREAETATGLHGTRVVVLPSPGMNAFSLADSEGSMAIGATEGLIGKLDRNELGAVIAHEASHLVHGDSRLLTTAGALSSVFDNLADMFKSAGSRPMGRWGGNGRSRSGGGIVLLWLVALFGKMMTSLLSMALSRNREYLADLQAVRMTKNPLALADALRKIAGKFRGGSDPPPGFKSVFILNPESNYLDEAVGTAANLFSTHPPVALRIHRLLDFAKADALSLKPDPKPEAAAPASPVIGADPRYLAFLGGAWVGPYNFSQLLAAGTMKPDTWVCPEGGQAMVTAGKAPDLVPLFEKQVQGKVAAETCPHCNVHMVDRVYEGAPVLYCPYCQGYLLKEGVLDRIVARHEVTFDPNQIQQVVAWRKAQPEKTLLLAPAGVAINCPECHKRMSKAFHGMLTRVVIDRCPYDGTVWLDGGELEAIQILVEQSSQGVSLTNIHLDS